MTYQLWETRTGNLIDDYRSKSDALDAVRGLLDDLGEDFVQGCSLALEGKSGDVSMVAEGKALLELALTTATA
ncbi:MAG: hypothetical protein WEB00_08475 [Dehalococcoidia bacterium]